MVWKLRHRRRMETVPERSNPRLLLPCGIIDCTGFWRSITQHKTQQGARFVRFTSLRVRGEAYREGEREGLVTEPAHSQHPVLFSSCNISHNSWRDFRAKSAGLNHQQQTRTTIEMLTKAWLVRSCQKQIPVTESSFFVSHLSFLSSCDPRSLAQRRLELQKRFDKKSSGSKNFICKHFQYRHYKQTKQRLQTKLSCMMMIFKTELEDKKRWEEERISHTHTQRQAKLWEAIVWIAKLWHEFRTPFFPEPLQRVYFCLLFFFLFTIVRERKKFKKHKQS